MSDHLRSIVVNITFKQLRLKIAKPQVYVYLLFKKENKPTKKPQAKTEIEMAKEFTEVR